VNNDHNFGGTLGTQYEYNQSERYWARVYDINSSLGILDGVGVVQLRDPSNNNNRTVKEHFALGSYFGRFNYDYKSKYLFEANGRYDGSSRFLAENRWNFYYGLSGGWRISQEDFLKDVEFLNELKLRASYGVVGNQSGS